MIKFASLRLTLNLITNPLQDNYDSFLEQLNLELLLSDDYYICCMVPQQTKCISNNPWYISCHGLLTTRKMKIVVCCLSAVFLTLNMISLFTFHSVIPSGKNFSILEVTLTISDITYCVYLLTLLIADNNHQHELMWKSGSICFTLFAFSLNYHILAPLLICISSFSRFLVNSFHMFKAENSRF